MMQVHIIKLEEEDEKTFLRLDANLSENHNLTFSYNLTEGLPESSLL